MIQVLIVEDSATAREFITQLIETNIDMTVVGIAKNGLEALELVKSLKPNIVTMDANMPVMNGLQTTRKIMEEFPTPIVMVSASWEPKDVSDTFRAVEAGALTVLEKPYPAAETINKEFIDTIRLMADVKVVGRRIKNIDKNGEKEISISKESSQQKSILSLSPDARVPALIAIGASTGGPPTFHQILSQLTQPFFLPIVIVQHMASHFVEGFAEWLGNASGFNVKIAERNEVLRPGVAYIAPADKHMGVTIDGLVSISPHNNDLHCPSVSHLFKSVAATYGNRAAAVILTGMGDDGAQELKNLREKGCITIAQDKESSVVHGMPGAAIRLEAATLTLSPKEIAEALNIMSIRRKAAQ